MTLSINPQRSMRAAVWHGRNDIRVEDVPLPISPPAGWVQIRVQWCGICGSDLHEYVAGPVFIPVDALHPRDVQHLREPGLHRADEQWCLRRTGQRAS